MEIENLVEYVKGCDDYVITFHQNPDGDAIGSALGLHLALKGMKKTGLVLSPNQIGEYLMWLPGATDTMVFEGNEKSAAELMKKAQTIFCLDFNDPNRTGPMENSLNASKATKVLIDHHLEPKHFAKYELHDDKSPATAQLIFRLIQEIDPDLVNCDIATNLYTGLMTDTGSFRFPSTNAETHMAIAKMMQTGFNHSIVHENIYDTNTVNRRQLLGSRLLNRLEIIDEFSTSIITVTKEDYEKFEIQKGDTEGLVNYNLSLEGIKFGVLFIENDDLVKISFRSKGRFPANLFAKKYFQGGGHLNAAGGRSFVSLEKTIKRFKSKLKDFIDENPIK